MSDPQSIIPTLTPDESVVVSLALVSYETFADRHGMTNARNVAEDVGCRLQRAREGVACCRSA